ncbi:protein ORF112 [Cyprinid herpesvirus 3]|uniref:ORF112R n=1 Tax=Cyprinid herpesvirus 3 TaxID=180230 RepID=A0A060ILC7_CYHV3|nr:ORF112R [Cyprinid herpesvirus 3]AVL28042.1 protein ORF112 [Cyprinid herpesvirus 3]
MASDTNGTGTSNNNGTYLTLRKKKSEPKSVTFNLADDGARVVTARGTSSAALASSLLSSENARLQLQIQQRQIQQQLQQLELREFQDLKAQTPLQQPQPQQHQCQCQCHHKHDNRGHGHSHGHGHRGGKRGQLKRQNASNNLLAQPFRPPKEPSTEVVVSQPQMKPPPLPLQSLREPLDVDAVLIPRMSVDDLDGLDGAEKVKTTASEAIPALPRLNPISEEMNLKILAYLGTKQGAKAVHIAQSLGAQRSEVNRHLYRMSEDGRVRKHPQHPVWYLPA